MPRHLPGFVPIHSGEIAPLMPISSCAEPELFYLLTNWLVYLYGQIQSPRPDVMPDLREGITRVAGFGFACIDMQAS